MISKHRLPQCKAVHQLCCLHGKAADCIKALLAWVCSPPFPLPHCLGMLPPSLCPILGYAPPPPPHAPLLAQSACARVILSAACADSGVREALADKLLAFWNFYRQHAGAARTSLSVRDLLAWVGPPPPPTPPPLLSPPAAMHTRLTAILFGTLLTYMHISSHHCMWGDMYNTVYPVAVKCKTQVHMHAST